MCSLRQSIGWGVEMATAADTGRRRERRLAGLVVRDQVTDAIDRVEGRLQVRPARKAAFLDGASPGRQGFCRLRVFCDETAQCSVADDPHGAAGVAPEQEANGLQYATFPTIFHLFAARPDLSIPSAELGAVKEIIVVRP